MSDTFRLVLPQIVEEAPAEDIRKRRTVKLTPGFDPMETPPFDAQASILDLSKPAEVLPDRDSLANWYRENYWRLEYPHHYVGHEINQPDASEFEKADLRVLVVRLSPYDSVAGSMTHGLLAMHIRDYAKKQGLNVYTDMSCLPTSMKDVGIFKEDKVPVLFGRTSKYRAADFDLLVVTVALTTEQFNLAWACKWAGVPIWKGERTDLHPVIFTGGVPADNYEPMYGPVSDAQGRTRFQMQDGTVVGEAEYSLPPMVVLAAQQRKKHWASVLGEEWATKPLPRLLEEVKNRLAASTQNLEQKTYFEELLRDRSAGVTVDHTGPHRMSHAALMKEYHLTKCEGRTPGRNAPGIPGWYEPDAYEPHWKKDDRTGYPEYQGVTLRPGYEHVPAQVRRATIPELDKVRTNEEGIIHYDNMGPSVDIQISAGCSSGGNCTFCLPSGSLVTMENGDSKPIEQIKVGDMVLTAQGKIRPVVRLFQREYEGQLVGLRIAGKEGLDTVTWLTPNHKVRVVHKNRYFDYTKKSVRRSAFLEFTDFEAVPAGGLTLSHAVLQPSLPSETKGTTFAFLWLAGLYAAYGKLEYRTGMNTPCGISIYRNKLSGETQETVDILKSFGISTVVNPEKGPNAVNVERIYIADKGLAQFLLIHVGEGVMGKKFSNLIMHGSKVEAQAVVDGFSYGDFTKGEKSRRAVFMTVNKTLAEQLWWLQKKTKPGSFVKLENSGGPKSRDKKGIIYRVEVPKGTKQGQYWSIAASSAAEIKEIERKDFKGTVYNIEVAEDHTYVVGHISVDNCHEANSGGRWRERSLKSIIKSSERAIRLQGAEEVQPYSFTWSYHSRIYSLLGWVYNRFGKCTLISQRADIASVDPEFFKIQRGTGKTSATIGVEGISQRIRDFLNKNCSEEQLLNAVTHAAFADFNSMKFFMISTGYETEEDVYEFCRLLDKVKAIGNEARDYRKQKWGDETKGIIIKPSFMTLIHEAHTPLQFAECRSSMDLDTDILKPVVEKCQEIGYSFKTSLKRKHIRLAQVAAISGREFTQTMMELVIRHDFLHYGGIPDWVTWETEQYLKKQGLDWMYYFREKSWEMVLPWDHVITPMSREYFWKAYIQAVNYRGVPYCLRTPANSSPKCWSCTACRTNTEKLSMLQRVYETSDLLREVRAHTKKMTPIMKVRWVMNVTEPTLRTVKKIVLGRNILRGMMLRATELGHNDLVRAFLTIAGTSLQAAENDQQQPWVMGRVLVDFYFNDYFPQQIFEDMIPYINAQTCMWGVKVESVVSGREMKPLSTTDYYGLFELELPTMSLETMRSTLEKLRESDNVNVRTKKSVNRDAFRLTEVTYTKSKLIPQITCYKTPSGDGIRVLFLGSVKENPYYMLETILKVRGGKWKKKPIICHGYFMLNDHLGSRNQAGTNGEADLFALIGNAKDSWCALTDRPIETDVLTGHLYESKTEPNLSVIADFSQSTGNIPGMLATQTTFKVADRQPELPDIDAIAESELNQIDELARIVQAVA